MLQKIGPQIRYGSDCGKDMDTGKKVVYPSGKIFGSFLASIYIPPCNMDNSAVI